MKSELEQSKKNKKASHLSEILGMGDDIIVIEQSDLEFIKNELPKVTY